ncbi:mucin-5AC-like [Haliotis rufescens]|uniref:mucin-5AC-like n=1 Tax=Haliotis rufescens TaxID=6454 RepID=UPI00201F33C5|nr:mucin-5AC-like [Haliotis rufescens]XP_048238512.1 mucin-5AC-like [Haliotis rufescens]XP_048238513.1 mucin-5AC-like [Haliotis rufescens]XP_048238514.1 mucin-5AC-like [Haliotis rufescens]XP_048238515.1 mucin-5AC-like [Haliotis rufescens]
MTRLSLVHLLTFALIHVTSPRTVPSSFTVDEDDLLGKLTPRRAPVIYPPLPFNPRHIQPDEMTIQPTVISPSPSSLFMYTSQQSQIYFPNTVRTIFIYTSSSSSMMSSLQPSSSATDVGPLETPSVSTSVSATSSSINHNVIRCPTPIVAQLETWSSTATTSETRLTITPTKTIHRTVRTASQVEPEPHPHPTSATSSASLPGQSTTSSISQSATTMMADSLPRTPQPSRSVTETSTGSPQPGIQGSKTILASAPMLSHLSQSTRMNTNVVSIFPTATHTIQAGTTSEDSECGSTYLPGDTRRTFEPYFRPSVSLFPSNLHTESFDLDGEYLSVKTLNFQSDSLTAPTVFSSTSGTLDQSSLLPTPDYIVVSRSYGHRFDSSRAPEMTQSFDVAADRNHGLHISRKTDVSRLPQVPEPLLGLNAALNELSGVSHKADATSSSNKSLLSILSKALSSMTTEPSHHTNSIPFRASDMFGSYLAQGAGGIHPRSLPGDLSQTQFTDITSNSLPQSSKQNFQRDEFSTTTSKRTTEEGPLRQLLGGMEALASGRTVATVTSTETTPSTTTTTTTTSTTTTTTTTSAKPLIPDICQTLCRLGQCPPSCVGRVSGWSR